MSLKISRLTENLLQSEIVVNDYSVKFGLTWKDIIFLPFYRLSVYGFTFVVYVSIAIAIFVMTFQPYGNYYDDVLFHFVTVLDFLYLARTVLAILHRIYQEHRCRKIFLPEPAFLLVIDAITLVPVAPYCFLINRFNWYNPIDYRVGYYYSFALKLPRIIRLYYLYKENYNDLARHPRTIVLLTHSMLSALLILILSSLYYTIYYYSPNAQTWADRFEDMERSNVSYKTPITCFLYVGGFFFKDILTPLPDYSMNEMRLAAATVFIAYVCHSVYLTSHLLAIYVQLMRFKHFFEWRIAKLGTLTKLLHFDQPLQDAINTYYLTIWMTRGGFVEQPEIVHLFPLQIKTEIAMDLYFDAIRHAKIFKNLNDCSKKELSLLFQTEILIPGQLMYQKDKVKSKLIYLHSGLVEVMSNENRDSPVLSFSPGTILGEISCILPYVGSADIRCSTTCVAHVLRHRDLRVLLSRDANLEYEMKQIIDERVEYARTKLHRMRQLENPISHIYWIKHRWRNLSRNKPGKVLPPDPLTKHFCSKYLNLLVLSTYYELKVHSICIRGQCSFVMEQDSSFRKFLELFCMTCVVMHFFITFPLIIFVGEIKSSVFALLTLFDLVYLLDIYFQAITAVRVHNVFISSPMDILVHKCKQFRFLLDIFASMPYDYFALLMGATPYYVGLCRLPKYIKLVKVVEFFNTNEKLLKLSTRTIKILRAISIHGFFIILSACFFYMWTCFNKECRPTGWLMAFKNQSRADFDKNLETSDFLISLIYTASVYLHMKIHHVQPANVIELLAQFAISVSGFYLLIMTIVQLAGGIALENYPRFLYMFNLSFFDSVFQDRPELRQFRPRVNEFISMQWFYTNSMQFNDIITLVNHKSKFVRHKVTHDFTIQNFRRTKIFCHMSDTFLDLISSYSNVYVIPAGHVLQRPNCSAAVLYIVLDGYCKVQSLAPEDEEKGNQFFLGKYDIFPIVGFFQKVNSFLYVESYTAIKVLAVPIHDFMNCVKALPQDGNILMNAINDHLNAHRNLIMRIVHLPLLHYPQPKMKLEEQDVNIFGFDGAHVQKGGNENLQWKKLASNPFKANLYAKFRQTYDPNGNYLYYEIYRCVAIIVEMILLYLSLHRFVKLSKAYAWINTCLLVGHIIDLFVRSHVHYFTNQGIRVTKPKATFLYYLNHSFIVDFISALPYQQLQVFEIFRGRSKNWLNIMISLFVQPLKLYRPFCLLTVVRKTIGIQYHNTILAISNSLAVSIFFFQASAFALALSCTINDDWRWECPSDSWLNHVGNYTYWKDHDLHYTRTFYEVVISNVMRSTQFFSYFDFLLFLFLGIFICGMTVWYIASIIGYTIFSTKYLVNLQERRRRYNNLASRVQFPKALRDELMEHYKYMFKKTRTDEPQDLLASFYPHLRESIQLAMFAPTLHEAKIFGQTGRDLFRFIVPFISEQYYIMNAMILRCNDINKNIFFVKKGYVEIVIADQSVAILGPGGMFGCFQQTGISRSTINVVAKIHADLLVIDTLRFLEVVKLHKQIKLSMKLADLTNCEYFESFGIPNKSSYTGESINRLAKCTLHNWYRYTFDDRNRFIVFYRYFTEMHFSPIASIVALISMVAISKDESEMYWIVVDIYFMIDMYMTCHIGRTDEESGLMIIRVWELTKVYLKSWKFYLDVITLIPLYLFKRYIKYKHDGILLVNKSFRIANMLLYYSTYLRTRYLPIHMRFTFLTYMFLFFLNAICFIICTTLLVLQNRSLSHREIVSYYLYVANIFTTAGIDPPIIDTFATLLYISAAVVLSSLLFVLITAGFCKLAVMIYYTDMEFRRAVITFKAYCQNEYISKPIVNQCWYYLMYLFQKHGGEQFPSLIHNAPNYLLEAHMLYLAEDLIYNHWLFRNAHHDFMRQMIRNLRYEFIMPGFTIVEMGDKRKNMYFIAEGIVLAMHSKEDIKNYEVLYKGACFGETQAIQGLRFPTTYKALTPVQLFGIKTRDWAYLLKWFPATGKTMMDAVRLSEHFQPSHPHSIF